MLYTLLLSSLHNISTYSDSEYRIKFERNVDTHFTDPFSDSFCHLPTPFFLLCAAMKELSPPPLNLRRLYAETMEWEPVLIIISPGADPSQELAELAAETVGRDNYHEVANNSIKW